MSKTHPDRILVTGAAGFIGTCLCRRLRGLGYDVVGVDNLSRPGSELNAMELAGLGVVIHRVDISDLSAIADVFAATGPFAAIFHLAAQVAVTKSYLNRRQDFAMNAVGSFHVIECAKRHSPEAYCLYASTNKVYGHLKTDQPVGMELPLNPYTPYGVSKAVGELYFTEYGRPEIGLATCSLRQSCIYGHHQFGVEDQGWLAWFTIANLLRRSVTIYGAGTQVRDLLYVEDLIDLYLECFERRIIGAYPVGGGVKNQIALLPAIRMIETRLGSTFARLEMASERPGDQPYFVADLAWTEGAGVAWHPRTSIPDGLDKMMDWMRDNRESIESVLK